MADYRNYSVETDTTFGTQKDKVEHNENVDQERHIGFKSSGQPHPHQEAADAERAEQKRKLGLAPDEEIEIIDWNGPDDPDNPFNWSKSYKWLTTLTTCFISILTGIPAGAYGAASAQMSSEWNVNQDDFPYLGFGLVTWNMGAAFFPLIFIPLTESTGRMPGYFVSYILFIIWLFPSAFSYNYATILVTRLFGGGCSSVAIVIVAGTITDIWKGDSQRSLPMSIFGWSSVVGIALGPFIGGAIQSGVNWRWIYWVQIIVDVAFLPVFWFILSETRGDVILAKRAAKMRKEGRRTAYAQSELNKPSILQSINMSFMRPIRMLTTEFVVIAFTIWVAFAWGLLFLFQSSVSIVMSNVYGFNTLQVTLVQLAIIVGATIATIINPYQDSLYLNSASRNTERPGKPIPEARLYTAVPGSLIFAAAMFWYGWTVYPSVHWIVPTLALGAFGIGVYSIYLGVTNYLADAYEKYAASALSAAGFGRNAFGAFLPLATPALYNNLNYHWASTLLGIIALVLTILPCILLWKGPLIRSKSPFMLEASFEEDEDQERKVSMATAFGDGVVEGMSRRASRMPHWENFSHHQAQGPYLNRAATTHF